MDSTNLCSVCQNYGHRVSKCPELGPNAPPPSGGGNSHSHDDDESAAVKIAILLSLSEHLTSVLVGKINIEI